VYDNEQNTSYKSEPNAKGNNSGAMSHPHAFTNLAHLRTAGGIHQPALVAIGGISLYPACSAALHCQHTAHQHE
jgi:hypothetical protein